MLDEPPDNTLFAEILALAEAWRTGYRAELARRGFPWHLTAGGQLLEHLLASGMSQSALTAASGLTKQAVQQLLDQLEKQGVVRRDADPSDKRAKLVVLTELGQRDLAERQAVLDELEARSREALGKKTFKKLRKSVRELRTG